MLRRVPKGHQYFHGVYHHGVAEAYFIPSGKEMIFDGEFKFRADLGYGRYERAEGLFQDNRKEGEWLFERKGSKSLKRLTMNFTQGHVEGHLVCANEEEGIGFTSLTAIEMTLSDGKPVGTIKGTLSGGDFIGACDEDGFPHGSWRLTFRHENTVHTRQVEVWRHGTLVESYEESVLRGSRTPMDVRICTRANYVLDIDCQSLMAIVRRGTFAPKIHIYTKGGGE